MNNELKDKLAEYKQLSKSYDSESEKRKEELLVWLSQHNEDRKETEQFLDDWLSELETDVDDIKQQALREQIDDEVYKMLPLGLIAKKYFGKSAAWLSQRINGTPVRGKVYTLSPDQKKIFNAAVKDVGHRIASFSL